MSQRMRRPDARALRKGKGDRIGLAIFAAVVLLVGAAAFAYAYLLPTKPIIDAATFCPVDGPESVTIVLVDVTDALTPAQQRDFKNQLEHVRAGIPTGGMLEIYGVAPTGSSLLTPVASLCNPGHGSEVSEWNGNPRKVEATWREGFEKPLGDAFSAIVESKEADRSPILESIQSVSLTGFQPVGRSGRAHKLIVASDLLQHTDNISFYKGLPQAEDLVKSAAFQTVRSDLGGVDVELWMLSRPTLATTQTRRLIDLWIAILSASGARVVRAYNVNG